MLALLCGKFLGAKCRILCSVAPSCLDLTKDCRGPLTWESKVSVKGMSVCRSSGDTCLSLLQKLIYKSKINPPHFLN